MHFWKRCGAILLSAAMVVGLTATSAQACTSIYVGSSVSESGSTFVGRSEDIGKLYTKIFEVREAADHEDGAIYQDTYGFSMPFPAHTYRYTVMRDSVETGETMEDGNGGYTGEAYGEAGVNENGVAVSATVSTVNRAAIENLDPLLEEGICEISLNTVILQSATTAREGVEILAAIIDEYGAGECNSISISDANEVWYFEILSGHQYVALKMPSDKVAINPNIILMNEVDVSDTENVVASPNLISLPQENGLLVTSQTGENPTVIDIARTYGAEDAGKGQYSRYWQGVYYLNQKLSESTLINYGNSEEVPQFMFDADRKLSTYEVLRFLATRGEGSDHASEVTGEYAIGNDRQAECHIFEIREDLPEELAILQWQTMSRAEYSVFLPYYSALITDTSDIFKSEYYPDVKNIEDVLDDADFPIDTSAYWVYAALNDLCDNDREHYGTNVKAFWAEYQQALIEQQTAVDEAMTTLYNNSPALAQKAATALGKAISEETFGYAKQILSELQDFIADYESGKLDKDAVFTPSIMGQLPHYSIAMAFEDVNADDWYSDAVSYVVTNGMMVGTEGNTFSPKGTVTRGTIMTVLARYAGQDTSGGSVWYEKGMDWAVSAGVSDGTKPTASITREQLATMLWRYAGEPQASADLSAYADADTVSSYATDAMNWAVETGLINGISGKLAPKGTATRAQVATIMMRYCTNVAQ